MASSDSSSEQAYIVTGASKGFGLAICEALLRRGARVGMIARGADELEASAERLVERHGESQVFAITGDVGRKADVVAAFATINAHFGQLDGLVNNAGLARPGSAEHLREDELRVQVNTNFIGTVLCCQAAIPLLRGAANPRIVNISSASAWHYDEMMHLSVYAATKAAVERYTRDLRLECQDDGIGVSCIRPGGAWTHFADGWDTERLNAGMAIWQRRWGSVSDSGMSVEQVAEAVCTALSQPPGTAIDLLEIRPNKIDEKAAW